MFTSLCVFLILVSSAYTALNGPPRLLRNPKLQGSCESREAVWCAEDRERRPVCGTDNETYSSRCALVKEQCRRARTPSQFSPKLYMKHKGPCSIERMGLKGMQTCWASRSAAERGKAMFIPHCLSDGTYAPVQCHEATNTCWCVNIHGQPMGGNLVKNGVPNCHRAGKRRIIDVSGIRSGGGRNRKDCGKIEKSNFFAKMDNIYRAEYNRTLMMHNKLSDEEFSKLAIKWKFSSLDQDGNGTLTKNEYSNLKRLVRKAVKPRECARDFIRLCDADRDTVVTLSEWISCHAQPRIKRRNEGRKGKKNRRTDNFQPKMPLINSNVYEQSVEETVEKQKPPEVVNCLSDRKAVMEEMKSGNEQTYVPECTPDGRYQQIQCYKSTGYCWCAYQDTGKPIPGTSVKDPNPKCDSVPSSPRPMKGCPEPKKQVFIKDLIEFMNKTLKGKDLSLLHLQESSKEQSQQEKIASQTFFLLDVNKNKVLERSEWKEWRIKLGEEKKLRKCGKKLPRYCDVNQDKKISLTEWLDCVTPKPSSSRLLPTVRRGKNPFETILKQD